jgi:hypothetical protein
MRPVRALAFLLGVASMTLMPSARADDAEPVRRGVGGIVDRGGFVLGLDNVFGFAIEGVCTARDGT